MSNKKKKEKEEEEEVDMKNGVDKIVAGKASSELKRCKEEMLFEKLVAAYSTTVGKAKSFEERSEKRMVKSRSLIYGEVKFRPFEEAIDKIKRRYGGLSNGREKFVDLGSGTGKAVFAATLCHDFASCEGIEIVESLHAIARNMHGDWKKMLSDDFIRSDGTKCSHTSIRLHLGDATGFDLSDVDLVFMCSTVFDYDLMTKLALCAGKMRVGTFMITLSKDLPCANWRVLERELRTASWGGATVIIQRKERPGHVPKSKFFRRREDESYKPPGTKTTIDLIKEIGNPIDVYFVVMMRRFSDFSDVTVSSSLTPFSMISPTGSVLVSLNPHELH
eukprot:g3782.t1